jgi:hypothetical protein
LKERIMAAKKKLLVTFKASTGRPPKEYEADDFDTHGSGTILRAADGRLVASWADGVVESVEPA